MFMIKKYAELLNKFNNKSKQKEWRKFEDRLPKLSVLNGCNIFQQKHSKTTKKRADIYAIDKENSRRRIIVDGKYCKEARKQHIQQIGKYNYPFFPTERYLVYPRNTIITESFRSEAKEKGVGIIKLRVEKVQRRRFIIFGKKEYPK